MKYILNILKYIVLFWKWDWNGLFLHRAVPTALNSSTIPLVYGFTIRPSHENLSSPSFTHCFPSLRSARTHRRLLLPFSFRPIITSFTCVLLTPVFNPSVSSLPVHLFSFSVSSVCLFLAFEFLTMHYAFILENHV